MNPSLLSSQCEINLDLIRRFGYHHADYRLYPEIEHFNEAFDANAYTEWLIHQKTRYFRKALSLYVHIPFCSSLCFYCQFNQIVSTNTNDNIKKYLDYLTHEIKLQGQLFEDDFKVEQLYFGGGTPTLLSKLQLTSIINAIQENFNLIKDGELYIEIDSRQIAKLSMFQLKEIGFNSAIIGVQDFDQSVQQSVHRFQTEDITLCAIRDAQHAGFKTIRVELIYGLPKQSLEKFKYTLDKIVAANPNQIRLLSYLHLPKKFKPHQNINSDDLPDEETRYEMFRCAIAYLTDVGYMHIGMNLFASHHDQLVIAQRQGRLYYGLQGYSIYPDCNHIALGISGVGGIGPTLNQNHCNLQAYYDKLEHNTLPIMRGIELSADDLIRRSVMQALICHSILSYESVETFFPIEFRRYFAIELTELMIYERAGLVTLNDEEIAVTQRGQLLIGSICRVFDKYLRFDRQQKNDFLLT